MCRQSKCIFKHIYHNGQNKTCFCKNILTSDELVYFIDNCLKENTISINWTGQKNLNDDHLKILAKSRNARQIKYLYLAGTNITYDGLRFLWKSLIFGNIRNEDPIYYSYYNEVVSVIKVEIKNTPALTQYHKLLEDQKKIFPFPLRKNFTIIYPNNQKEVGFKEIVLLNDGNPIE